jgi:hypothetical protein
VLPNHVSKLKDRISLAAPAPATRGAAEVFWRDPTNDLALAYVEGALSDRCTITLNGLSRDLSSTLLTAETGLIKSVHFDGAFFDRIGAVLVDVDDMFITTRVTDTGIDAEVMQGLSGAMLSVGGTIAGIAIDAKDTGEARFLRTDRILELIAAKLDGTLHPSTRPIDANANGQGFRVSSFEGGNKSGVVALEPGGLTAPWITEWTGTPIEFEITLSNDQMLPVNKISMFTFTSPTETPARRIEVQIDRGMPGSPYWTPVITPDMSPTGAFEATTGGTMGRRLKIKILDVWHPERMLRIDQLAFE